MPESQNPLCASCRAIEPEQSEEHFQSEWKQECENDEKAISE
jgi:hypothetical protein